MNYPAQENDAASTRNALLQTGVRLFAERGFDGTSIRAITSEANANLGAVTYHFGSKEAFYDAVVDSVVGPFAEQVLAAGRTDGPPLDRLTRVVRVYFGHLAEHPEIPRLIMQGVMATGLPPGAASGWIRSLLTMLASTVAEGQADGSIRPGDPRLLGIGVVSQSLHLAVMRDALNTMAGIDLSNPRVREGLIEHLVEYVRARLAADGEGSGA